MSEENVDKVRAFYDAVNRRDFDDALRYMDPEIDLYPGVTGVDVSRRYHGHDGVRQFLETITEGFDLTVVPEEMIEAPGDRVLAVEHWYSRGQMKGFEVDLKLTDVYAFRDGLIVRGDGFRDKAEALEAAGLSE